MASNLSLVKRISKNLYSCADNSDKNDYYSKHFKVLNNVFFKDTFYNIRFIDLYFDLVLSKNNSIHHLIRNQYHNGNTIYDSIFGDNIDNIDNINIDTIIERILKIDKNVIEPFYNSIVSNLIMPLLRRHDIYSDNLFNILFYKMIMYTGHMYSHHTSLKRTTSEFLNVKTKSVEYCLQLQPIIESSILMKEKEVWLIMARKKH